MQGSTNSDARARESAIGTASSSTPMMCNDRTWMLSLRVSLNGSNAGAGPPLSTQNRTSAAMVRAMIAARQAP